MKKPKYKSLLSRCYDLYAKNDQEKCIEKLNQILKNFPRCYQAYYTYALIKEEKGKFEEAFELFYKAALIKKTDINMWLRLHNYSKEYGRPEIKCVIINNLLRHYRAIYKSLEGGSSNKKVTGIDDLRDIELICSDSESFNETDDLIICESPKISSKKYKRKKSCINNEFKEKKRKGVSRKIRKESINEDDNRNKNENMPKEKCLERIIELLHEKLDIYQNEQKTGLIISTRIDLMEYEEIDPTIISQIRNQIHTTQEMKRATIQLSVIVIRKGYKEYPFIKELIDLIFFVKEYPLCIFYIQKYFTSHTFIPKQPSGTPNDDNLLLNNSSTNYQVSIQHILYYLISCERLLSDHIAEEYVFEFGSSSVLNTHICEIQKIREINVSFYRDTLNHFLSKIPDFQDNPQQFPVQDLLFELIDTIEDIGFRIYVLEHYLRSSALVDRSLLVLGRLYYNRDQRKSLSFYEEYLKRHPDDNSTRLLISNIYESLGMINIALDYVVPERGLNISSGDSLIPDNNSSLSALQKRYMECVKSTSIDKRTMRPSVDICMQTRQIFYRCRQIMSRFHEELKDENTSNVRKQLALFSNTANVLIEDFFRNPFVTCPIRNTFNYLRHPEERLMLKVSTDVKLQSLQGLSENEWFLLIKDNLFALEILRNYENIGNILRRALSTRIFSNENTHRLSFMAIRYSILHNDLGLVISAIRKLSDVDGSIYLLFFLTNFFDEYYKNPEYAKYVRILQKQKLSLLFGKNYAKDKENFESLKNEIKKKQLNSNELNKINLKKNELKNVNHYRDRNEIKKHSRIVRNFRQKTTDNIQVMINQRNEFIENENVVTEQDELSMIDKSITGNKKRNPMKNQMKEGSKKKINNKEEIFEGINNIKDSEFNKKDDKKEDGNKEEDMKEEYKKDDIIKDENKSNRTNKDEINEEDNEEDFNNTVKEEFNNDFNDTDRNELANILYSTYFPFKIQLESAFYLKTTPLKSENIDTALLRAILLLTLVNNRSNDNKRVDFQEAFGILRSAISKAKGNLEMTNNENINTQNKNDPLDNLSHKNNSITELNCYTNSDILGLLIYNLGRAYHQFNIFGAAECCYYQSLQSIDLNIQLASYYNLMTIYFERGSIDKMEALYNQYSYIFNCSD